MLDDEEAGGQEHSQSTSASIASLSTASLMVRALPQTPDMLVGSVATDGSRARKVRCCDGFRMPAHRESFHAHGRAGVRKPPGNEVAGEWAPDGSAGSMGNWLARSVQQDAGWSSIVAGFGQRRAIEGQTGNDAGRIAVRARAFPLRDGALKPSRVGAGR